MEELDNMPLIIQGDPKMQRARYQVVQEVKLVSAMDPRNGSGVSGVAAAEGSGVSGSAALGDTTANPQKKMWIFPYFQKYIAENGSVKERQDALARLAGLRRSGLPSAENDHSDNGGVLPQRQATIDVHPLSIQEIGHLIEEGERRAEAAEEERTASREDDGVEAAELKPPPSYQIDGVSYAPSGHTLRKFRGRQEVNPRPPVVDIQTWCNTTPKVRLEYLCNYRQTLGLRCTTNWDEMRTWLLEEHAPHLLPTGHKFPWGPKAKKGDSGVPGIAIPTSNTTGDSGIPGVAVAEGGGTLAADLPAEGGGNRGTGGVQTTFPTSPTQTQ